MNDSWSLTPQQLNTQRELQEFFDREFFPGAITVRFVTDENVTEQDVPRLQGLYTKDVEDWDKVNPERVWEEYKNKKEE